MGDNGNAPVRLLGDPPAGPRLPSHPADKSSISLGKVPERHVHVNLTVHVSQREEDAQRERLIFKDI